MKRRVYIACFSAAAAALSVGLNKAQADILQWDASGNSAPTYTDGPGNWDTTTPEWVDQSSPSMDIPWSNTTPANSAVFGNTSPTATIVATATPIEVDLATDITVQDITLGMASTGAPYQTIGDGGGNSLTINGNITKSAPTGADQFFFLFGNLTLGDGDHTIAANDTSGSAAPEIEFDASIGGTGNVIIDNGSYAAWGVTAFAEDNSYTGTTLINKGELVITSNGALGSTSAGTTIANEGDLSLGGNGKVLTGGLNISEPITITRNTYTGTDYSDYPDAIISANTGQPSTVNTFSGPIVVDSTDARVATNTSTLIISGPVTVGPDLAAGTSAVLDLDGDFAGFVQLTADNTAFSAAGGVIEIRGGVELTVDKEYEIGGASSKLLFTAGTIHPTGDLLTDGFMTNFGSHDLSGTPINTGVDIDANQTFTVNGLSGVAIGERGMGTMDFNGTNTFTGVPFFDSGTININGSTTLGAFRLRSPVLNINSGATLTTTNSFTDIGSDSPDNGTLNVLGGGKLALANQDFNVSDNANTQGTLNVFPTAIVTMGGGFYIGKSAGSTGTVNQTGGSVTNTNGGGASLSIGGTGGTGVYTMSGGTLSIAGEMWVGNANNSTTAIGNGTFTQTAGTTTVGSWFVVGRQNGIGTLTISGGTLTRTATNTGNNNYVGEDSNTTSVLTVNGTGAVTINGGQFWLGNAGSSKGTLNIADTGSFTVTNNWLAVGRNGTAQGVINLSGGTLTATGSYNLSNNSGSSFTIGSGGTAVGTVTQTGGTLNSSSMFIGENGTGTYSISAGTANLSGALTVGTSGAGKGTFNISGTAVVNASALIFGNAGTSTGTLNLNGGTLNGTAFTADNGLGTGKGTFVFNGGTLAATSPQTNFIGLKVTSVVSTGGAIINTNSYAETVNSILTHDTTLSGADGGLTKQGAGTLTLVGAETYTGPTTISGGTLKYTGNYTQNLASLSIANGAVLDVSGGNPINIAAGLPGYLADIQTAYDNGKWDGTSATAPAITSSFAATHPGVGVGYATSGSGLELRLTYFGDTQLTGTPTYAEINAITPMTSGGTWSTGDFNYDGKVNADDFSLAFLGVAESNGASITAVAPEPAAFLVGLPALFGPDRSAITPKRHVI